MSLVRFQVWPPPPQAELQANTIVDISAGNYAKHTDSTDLLSQGYNFGLGEVVEYQSQFYWSYAADGIANPYKPGKDLSLSFYTGTQFNPTEDPSFSIKTPVLSLSALESDIDNWLAQHQHVYLDGKGSTDSGE